MNKVVMIGNLTKDPEIKVTQSGKKLASFSIAVNDGKRDGQDLVQYFNMTAWEKLAEIIEMYVKKGHKVAIEGRLQNRSWDKPDGTKGYATDISVSNLEMLTSKTDAEKINQMNQNQPNSGTQSKNQNSDTQDNSGQKAQEKEQLPEINVDDMNVQMPF